MRGFVERWGRRRRGRCVIVLRGAWRWMGGDGIIVCRGKMFVRGIEGFGKGERGNPWRGLWKGGAGDDRCD